MESVPLATKRGGGATAGIGSNKKGRDPRLKVELRDTEKIIPYDRNPRVNDGAVEAVARSIKAYGWRVPIVVDRQGVVIAGHTRLKAAMKLGLQRVPVHVAADMTPAQAKAYRLADNRTSELAEWDSSLLSGEIDDLNALGADLGDIGWTPAELSELIGTETAQGLTDPDEIPPTPAETVTKTGDLWAMGDHRLLCGDCTDGASVRRLMAGERAALFATDPPYLVDYDGTNHPSKTKRPESPTKNKDWSGTYGVTWDDADANPELYDRFIATAKAEALASNAAWYCWHASRRQAMLEAAWVKHGAFVHCQIIWVKNRPVLTRSDFSWQHEPCFYGWVQGKRPWRTREVVLPTVWPIDTLANGPDRPDHPTPKPVEVFRKAIEYNTRPREICYEPFAGSGTQVIAAEQLGRRCFATEISPTYCDVVVQRWEKFTGRKAELTERP